MKEITIYVPTDPKVELPEKQYDSTTSGHYSLITESNMNCTGWYYHKNHKWILDGYDSLPIKAWLKPVTISEKEISKVIRDELMFVPYDACDRTAKAITALMRGEK